MTTVVCLQPASIPGIHSFVHCNSSSKGP